jgi:hypothetical protein
MVYLDAERGVIVESIARVVDLSPLSSRYMFKALKPCVPNAAVEPKPIYE